MEKELYRISFIIRLILFNPLISWITDCPPMNESHQNSPYQQQHLYSIPVEAYLIETFSVQQICLLYFWFQQQNQLFYYYSLKEQQSYILIGLGSKQDFKLCKKDDNLSGNKNRVKLSLSFHHAFCVHYQNLNSSTNIHRGFYLRFKIRFLSQNFSEPHYSFQLIQFRCSLFTMEHFLIVQEALSNTQVFSPFCVHISLLVSMHQYLLFALHPHSS